MNRITDRSKNQAEMAPPICPRFSPDAGGGLTDQQVEAKKAAGLTNTAVSSNSRSVGSIIRDNLFTYFNFVFLILALLVILSGSLRSLTFLIFSANKAVELVHVCVF